MTTRCGLVAVLGAPNAGKSTLVNALVGQKVAIVSPKAQTTRARLMGIAIEGEAQILLVDTPGIFIPNRRLDRAMVKAAWEGAEDADRMVLVIDAAAKIGGKVEQMIEGVESAARTTDPGAQQGRHREEGRPAGPRGAGLSERLKPEAVFMISATTGDGVADLKAHLAEAMPEGPWHFPEDQLTDVTDRMVAAELTREQLYHQLHAELPYASAVATEKWEDRKDGSTVIHQQILVERDSQKAIVVGKGGSRLKAIGAGGARGDRRASRPQGPPVPACEGQPALGRGPRALRGYRAGLGGLRLALFADACGGQGTMAQRHDGGDRKRSNLGPCVPIGLHVRWSPSPTSCAR